jgi:hypothetical protein
VSAKRAQDTEVLENVQYSWSIQYINNEHTSSSRGQQTKRTGPLLEWLKAGKDSSKG